MRRNAIHNVQCDMLPLDYSHGLNYMSTTMSVCNRDNRTIYHTRYLDGRRVFRHENETRRWHMTQHLWSGWKPTFRFTGSSKLSSLYASTTCNQPSTGPLSSVEPRPYNFPSFSVSTNGSVSQPSSWPKIQRYYCTFLSKAAIRSLQDTHPDK